MPEFKQLLDEIKKNVMPLSGGYRGWKSSR
jgi:hypothetical protein